MAITKVTSKSSQVAQSIASPVNLSKTKSQTTILCEELIEIQLKLESIAAAKLTKRADEIKKALQEVMNESGADEDQPYVFKTPAGTVEFGPRSNTTEIIDKVTMIKMLGMDTFKTIAKVGITDLKTYLSGAEIEQFTAKSKGSRSIKSVKAAE